MRKLGSLLLLSVVAISLFALMEFIKPAQMAPDPDPYPWGTHKIYVNYYKTKLAYDHDMDIWPFVDKGEWYFRLYSPGGNSYSGEYSVDKDRNGWKTVDHADLTVDYTFSGSTYFKMWAGEDDGILGWDYIRDYTVNIPANWGYYAAYKPGEYHPGNKPVDDVSFYWEFYIYNYAPTADPVEDQLVNVGIPVWFNGTASDPEGDDLSYEWDFDYDGFTFTVDSTEQNANHTFLEDRVYIIALRVKDYFGAYSTIQTAKVTSTHVIIDKTFVTDTRCDVSSLQTVGFHAKWAHNNSDIKEGVVYVNGISHDTNETGWINFDKAYDTVGRYTWSVTGTNCTGITVYEQNVTDPYIIWDRLEVHHCGVSDGRCDVGTAQTVWMKARYDYDDEIFDDGKGYLSIGGIAATWDAEDGYWYITDGQNTVTKVDYLSPSSFTDTTYGLTTITGSVTQSIIWDKVSITLSAVDDTVEAGSTASITRTATYQYDGTDFDGTITLNDTLTKSIVGTFYYTTQSISGDTHGITAFDTNTVAITFIDTTAPVANAGLDQTVTVDTSVSFDASNSTENVEIVSYEWDFGDETTGTGITTEHTYTEPGTYTVTLTVKDAAGNSHTDSITITVEAAPVTFPLWIIGVLIAVIVVGIIVTALLLQRRRATKVS